MENCRHGKGMEKDWKRNGKCVEKDGKAMGKERKSDGKAMEKQWKVTGKGMGGQVSGRWTTEATTGQSNSRTSKVTAGQATTGEDSQSNEESNRREDGDSNEELTKPQSNRGTATSIGASNGGRSFSGGLESDKVPGWTEHSIDRFVFQDILSLGTSHRETDKQYFFAILTYPDTRLAVTC